MSVSTVHTPLDPPAPWSFHQAWQRAGIPDKAARHVLARGLIPDKGLTPADVLTLRALATTDRFGAWHDLPAMYQHTRDESLARLCRDLPHMSPLEPETLAMVLPQVAALTHPRDLPRLYPAGATMLLLPVGAWWQHLREHGHLPAPTAGGHL